MALQPGSYFGRAAAPRSLNGFRISEVEYTPGLVIPRHDHELAGFCFVRQGAYDETVGRCDRACEAGTLVMHPAGEHHSEVHRDCTVRLLSVEIAAERHAQLRASIDVLGESRHVGAGEIVQLARKLEVEAQHSDSASSLVIEGLVLEILALDARQRAMPTPRIPSWLARADEFMRAHFRESLSVVEIADAAGVHATHLARGFRQHYRRSVGDHLRQLRIEWAKTQLLSDASLGEIALDAGFADQSHFTRLFRASVGVTPSRFRAQHS